MDQALDAGFDFHESAVRHDIDHLAVDLAAFRILGDDIVPRIAGLLLEAEGDALFFLVDADDDHFDLFADLEHFGRMRNPAPADVGDMQQTVHAAEVDERAEIGDVLDHALAEFVDLHFSEQLAALILEGLLEQFAAGNHDIAAVEIDLDDLDIEFLADVVIHIVHRAHIELRAGQEGREAFDIDHDAALDAVTHEPLDNMTFAVFGGDAVPGLDRISLFKADLRHIVAVFDLFEVNIDLVADIRFVELQKLGGGHESLGLVADVYQRTVGAFCDDLAFDDLALGESVGAFAGLQQLIHRARDVGKVQETFLEFVFFCHVVLCSCFG